VRFNPNLYADGKVCLSVLGTWASRYSEAWIPGTSTMLQIMISIQSLVMNSDPYFNEPGYEDSYNTKSGHDASREYNHSVRLNCMKWAMIDILDNPPRGFEDVIHDHFKLKAKHIKNICSKWISEAPESMIESFKTTYESLCEKLDGINPDN
jgi:hypothetical protein